MKHFEKSLLILILFLPNIALAQVPTIDSFSPAFGIVGSIVNITGNNFNLVPESNIVYFGAVRAKVLSSTDTQLTVVVPTGATYQPITVTNNRLTAYSKTPFNIIFPGKADRFIEGSFSAPIDTATNQYPGQIVIADFNNDGKVDIITAETNNSGTISVFQNISSNGNIALAERQTISPVTLRNTFIASGDLDGDGKIDIVVSSFRNSCFSFCYVGILQNISTDSSIVFSQEVSFPVTVPPYNVFIHDIDLDGKPDLVMAGLNSKIGIFRNTSTENNISFTQGPNLPTLFSSKWLALGDMDLNGKVDFVVSSNNDSSVSVFQNISNPGIIQFAERADFKFSDGSEQIAIEDLNQDGKPDIVAVNSFLSSPHTISILKNSTSNGNISFSPKIDIEDGLDPTTLTIGDLDGDDKPDLIVENYEVNKIRIYKNITENGSISFNSGIDYNVGSNPWFPTLADLNGDGKPDLVVSNWDGNSISILKNNINDKVINKTCAYTPVNFYAPLSGVNYQWQLSTDSSRSFFDISDNINYVGTKSDNLQIHNLSTSWYGYHYRCMVDGDTTNLFSLQFENKWIGGIDSSWENPVNWSCNIVPDNYTDVIISSGTTIINSNSECRTLTILPGANLIINTGYTLVITH